MINLGISNILNTTFYGSGDWCYRSPLMQNLSEKIDSVAKRDSNVVIAGEFGSGREAVANLIHQRSARSRSNFSTFYCVGAEQKDFRENFGGHICFVENNISIIYKFLEETSEGNLFLNRFSELSDQNQRDIIDSYVEGTKGESAQTNKPRLILSITLKPFLCVNNQDICDYIMKRINPILIMLPPLREIKEEIPSFIELFINEFKKGNDFFANLSISTSAVLNCIDYYWPGNILQLKNAIYHASVFSNGGRIEPHHLPFSTNEYRKTGSNSMKVNLDDI